LVTGARKLPACSEGFEPENVRTREQLRSELRTRAPALARPVRFEWTPEFAAESRKTLELDARPEERLAACRTPLREP
jgi:hypothetical protein